MRQSVHVKVPNNKMLRIFLLGIHNAKNCVEIFIMKHFIFVLLTLTLTSCSEHTPSSTSKMGQTKIERLKLEEKRIPLISDVQVQYDENKVLDEVLMFANLQPPNGTSIQSTNAIIYKEHIIVTYNSMGSDVVGGIDVISLGDQIELKSGFLFQNAEFSTLIVYGDYLIAGGQCLLDDLSTSACLYTFHLTDQLYIHNINILEGFYVTGFTQQDDKLYVSSATHGGVSVFTLDEFGFLVEESFNSIANALDVKSNYGNLYVLNGEDKLQVSQVGETITPILTLEENICDSPTRMTFHNDDLFVNSCLGANYYVSKSNMDKFLAGDESSVTAINTQGRANGLTRYNSHLLIALGELGLCSYDTLSYPMVFEGCFDFKEDSGSANNIISLLSNDETYYILADGLSGTKILKKAAFNPNTNLRLDILSDQTKLYDSSNNEYSIESAQGKEFVLSQLVDVYDQGFVPCDNCQISYLNKLVFENNHLESNNLTIDDNSNYQIEMLLEFDELPSSDYKVFYSDEINGMSLNVDNQGRLFLKHNEDVFLQSDILLKEDTKYYVNLVYDKDNGSYLKINNYLVAQSTNTSNYTGGKLILGDQNKGNRLFVYRLALLDDSEVFTRVDEPGRLNIWVNENHNVENPYEEEVDFFANLVLHLEANPNYFFKKVGNTESLASVGEEVYRWKDLSDSQCDVIQNSQNKRPIVEMIDQISSVKFEGKQYLECNQQDVMGSEQYTKIVVVKINDFNAKNNLISSGVGNGHALYMGDSQFPQLWHSHYRFAFSTVALDQSKLAVIYASYGNGEVENYLYINNQLGTSTPEAVDFEDKKIEIGSHGGGNNLKGELYEVRVYNKSLDTQTRNSIIQSLMNKYNITNGVVND